MQKVAAATAVLLILIAGLATSLEVGDQQAISVQEGELRSSPGFLSSVTARVEYGEMVEILEPRPGWARVRVVNTGDEGWLHASAVAQPRELRLEPSGSTANAATSREIALAGRGFNEQVEAQYKSEKDLDFASVDEMEGYGLPVEQIASFFADAGLSISGGAE